MSITCINHNLCFFPKIVNIIDDYLSEEINVLRNLVQQSLYYQPQSIANISRVIVDWTQRPRWVDNAISMAFHDVNAFDGSEHWLGFEGAKQYFLCSIDEDELIKSLIKEKAASRKNYYVLDIGAGDFSWSRFLAKYINQQTDLPSDFILHIINMIGESSVTFGCRSMSEKRGKCMLYYLHGFKVEDLISELHRCDISLEGEIDLIVSRWCLRHLVDPVGTFLQALHMLRDGGFFLGNGFHFLLEQDKNWANYISHSSDPNRNMINLLLNTHLPFLTSDAGSRSLNEFIIKKTGKTFFLKMEYIRSEDIRDSNSQIFSQRVMHFKSKHSYKEPSKINFPQVPNLHGSKQLYYELVKSSLIDEKSNPWKPIVKKDASL